MEPFHTWSVTCEAEDESGMIKDTYTVSCSDERTAITKAIWKFRIARSVAPVVPVIAVAVAW